jgi:hypothetical protein
MEQREPVNMTKEQQTQLEKDALHAVYTLEQEARALKLRISLIGQPLERLGRALQQNPEQVSPLPDPHFLYDYTQGLNLLQNRQEVIQMCEELRHLEQEIKVAKSRIAVFNGEAPASRDFAAS